MGRFLLNSSGRDEICLGRGVRRLRSLWSSWDNRPAQQSVHPTEVAPTVWILRVQAGDRRQELGSSSPHGRCPGSLCIPF